MNESTHVRGQGAVSKRETLLCAPSCAPFSLQVQASWKSEENTVVDSNDFIHQGLTCVTIFH